MSREDAYTALFAKLQAAAPFNVTSRQLRALDDMKPSELPALFMITGNQSVEANQALPSQHDYSAEVFIYAGTQDKTVAPGTVLNTLLDAVEAALAPPPTDARQTLGGVVYWCRVQGVIEVFEGTLASRAAAVVPIKMLVPW